MLSAITRDNRLVITGAAQGVISQITSLHQSARRYGSNIHLPITPHTVAELAKVLKLINQQITPVNEKLRDILTHYNELERYGLIKADERLPQPAVRRTDSWTHQLQGYHFAKKVKTTMLDMGVGTGKTKVAIDVMQNTSNLKRVLVAMPRYILEDDNAWHKQLRMHGNFDYYVLRLNRGTVAKKAEEVIKALAMLKRSNTVLIVMMNYESLWREPLASLFLKEFQEMIVFDESHRIKSHNSKVSEYSGRLAQQHEYRLCLTGTMLANSPLDVFGQFRALDVGIFGSSFTRFRSEYADVFEKDGVYMITGYKNLDRLAEKISRITYHAPSSVLNLPEARHEVRGFNLEPKERKLYDELERSFGLELQQGTLSAANKLVLLLRLQQFTGGCVPLESDDTVEVILSRISESKVELFEQVLSDIPRTEKVIVFYRFNADADIITERCKKLKLRIGEISGRRYDKKAWDAGELDVVALNIKSGEGIDLSQANYGIGYSFGHSLKDYEQCLGRIQRPPRTSTAYFIHLLAYNTVDEVIHNALINKRNIVDEVVSHYISN